MKQICTLLITAVLFTTNVQAQLFQNYIGATNNQEYGDAIAAAADSSYLLGAHYTTTLNGTALSLLVHLKKNGSLDWTKFINLPTSLSVHFVDVDEVHDRSTANGYIAIIDVFKHFYVVRLSNTGSLLWTRKLSNDAYFTTSADRIKTVYTSGGALSGFLLMGNHFEEADGAFMMKLNTSGVTVWQKKVKHTIATAKYDFIDFDVTPDGGCIIIAHVNGSGVNDLPVLIKMTSAGAVSWLRGYRFDNSYVAVGKAITVAKDSGYAVTGYVGGNNNLVFKTNSSGTLSWAYQYTSGTLPHVEGSSIACDKGGNLIVSGTLDDAAIKPAVLIKLSSLGNVITSKKLYKTNLTYNDLFNDVKVTKAGTYCAVGTTDNRNVKAGIYAVNVSALVASSAGCINEYFSLSKGNPVVKIPLSLTYNVSNENLNNVATNPASAFISGEQKLCGGTLAEEAITAERTGTLQVGNDLQGRRLIIKWTPPVSVSGQYEALLVNNFGQQVAITSLNGTQTAYLSMGSMQSGLYSVAIRQNNKIVAQEKVVWTKQ